MATYTWSRENRWFKALCTNGLDAETAKEIGCGVCVEPLEVTVDTCYFLDDVSTVSGAPRDIRGYGDQGATPRFYYDDDPGVVINHVAMRFEDLVIPQGQTLESASLVLKMDGTAGTEDLVLRVYGDVTAADAGELPTASSLLTWGSFTETSAYGSVTMNGPLSSGQEFTIDITNVMNEIVAQGAWASGNDVILLLSVQAGSTAIFDDVPQYDTTTTPQLCVRF